MRKIEGSGYDVWIFQSRSFPRFTTDWEFVLTFSLGKAFTTRSCRGLSKSCLNAGLRRSATEPPWFGTARSAEILLLFGNQTAGMGTLRRTLRRWNTGGIAGGRRRSGTW